MYVRSIYSSGNVNIQIHPGSTGVKCYCGSLHQTENTHAYLLQKKKKKSVTIHRKINVYAYLPFHFQFS